MPIISTWLYPNPLVIQRHSGDITVKQLTDSYGDLKNLISEGEPPVHIIVDASNQGKHVDVRLGDLKSLVPRVFDDIGWMVVIQPHALHRFFTALGMQIARAKYKFVQNEAEAISFLVEQDPTLRDVIR